MKRLQIKDKSYELPIFMPDATKGVIRGVLPKELSAVKVEGLVTNTYHLMSQPGATVISGAGKLHKFLNWNGYIVTDSGGFQLLSMIYKNNIFGKISDRGVTFKNPKTKKTYDFTPEKSIQTQYKIGADILICLDDCPRENCTKEENKLSVDRTIRWAKKCKQEFVSLTKSTKQKPLLFAVIQGGADKEQRKRCAESLLDIGFDGFGFGGWPLLESKKLNIDILEYTAELIPDQFYKYALGVGDPTNIYSCVQMGWEIFDCVLPTRDGRHARLYNLKNDLSKPPLHYHINILEERYTRDYRPVDETCDCELCKNFSRAYLHHLFMIEDNLAGTLASIHNLRTYTRLIETLRNELSKSH